MSTSYHFDEALLAELRAAGRQHDPVPADVDAAARRALHGRRRGARRCGRLATALARARARRRARFSAVS